MAILEMPQYPLTARDTSRDERCGDRFYCVDCREMHDCNECAVCIENARRDREFDEEQSTQFHRELREYFANPDVPCQRCSVTRQPQKRQVKVTDVQVSGMLMSPGVVTGIIIECADREGCNTRLMERRR